MRWLCRVTGLRDQPSASSQLCGRQPSAATTRQRRMKLISQNVGGAYTTRSACLPACLLLVACWRVRFVATSSARWRISQTQAVVRHVGIFLHINLENAQWGGKATCLCILAFSFTVSMHTFQKLIFHLVGSAGSDCQLRLGWRHLLWCGVWFVVAHLQIPGICRAALKCLNKRKIYCVSCLFAGSVTTCGLLVVVLSWSAVAVVCLSKWRLTRLLSICHSTMTTAPH